MWTLRDLFRALVPGYEDKYREEYAQRYGAKTPQAYSEMYPQTLEEYWRVKNPLLTHQMDNPKNWKIDPRPKIHPYEGLL